MRDDEYTADAGDGPDWDRLARDIALGGPEGARPFAGGSPHDAGRDALVSALAAVLRVSEPIPPTHDEVGAALAAVMARRDRPERAVPTVARRAAPRRAWQPAWGIAAVLVVAFGAVVWSRFDRADARRSAGPGAGAVTVATAPGQVDSLRLPDGSRIVLGPASRLVREADYGAHSRDLTLEGQALFDVVHDAARPFVVHTSRGELRDVGTTFSVRSDAPAGLLLEVRSGVVGLRRAGAASRDETLVSAGQRATMPSTGSVVVERSASTQEDTAWTHGRLVLENAPLVDVVDAMRRWYGLDLRVTDPALASRRVTATFDRETGAEAVRIVAAVMGGVVRVAGDTVTVTAAPAAPAP